MLPDLGGLVRELAEARIRYVVIGGIAVAAHAFVRATEDLDIVPDPTPANLDELCNMLLLALRRALFCLVPRRWRCHRRDVRGTPNLALGRARLAVCDGAF
jgi:hypothetical protein